MGDFAEHISQAKRNLDFLAQTNKNSNHAWDWQVTICFYVGVHLVNAHISTYSLQYRSHTAVKNALSPAKQIPIGCEFSKDLYMSYVKIQNLSRRSRYLCKDVENPDPEDKTAYFTVDKHLRKAIGHLDNLIKFISEKYGVSFEKRELNCIEMKGIPYKYFACKN